MDPQQELLALMERLSEEAWASGWQRRLEYDLWALVKSQDVV